MKDGKTNKLNETPLGCGLIDLMLKSFEVFLEIRSTGMLETGIARLTSIPDFAF
jgi:hypothetical protein